ncbi:MAG TPA: type II secretion system F family protein [Acidothermaceae bacterium]|jgi:tight adherence protein B
MKRAGAWATGLTGIAALALSVGPVALSISPAIAATPAPTASAANPSVSPTGRIESQSSKPGQLDVTFSAIGLPTGESVDVASVHVFLNGTPVDSTAMAVGSTMASAVPETSRTAVLVVDTSSAMKGAGLAGAQAAALAFLKAVPADAKVGLVAVSTTASLVTAPTIDRAALTAAINRLTASGGTALYDATLIAERAVGTMGSRTIVLLTGSRDDSSKSSLPQAVSAAQLSGAVIDAISLGTVATQVAPLQQLTAASGGRLLATQQVAQFAPAFRSAAQDISTEILITAQVPAQFAGQGVTVAVTAKAGNTTVSDSAAYQLSNTTVTGGAASNAAAADSPRPEKVTISRFGSHTDLMIGIAAVFVGLLALFVLLAFNARLLDTRDTRMRRRLSSYTLTGRTTRTEAQPTALGDSSVTRSAVQLAGRLVVSRDFDARLGRRLDAAGVPLKPAEWIVVQAGSAVALGLLFLLLGGGSAVAAILGILIGIGGPIGYLVMRESRRSTAFLEQLPDTLQLIAGSISVGHSLAQAMDAVVREDVQPMSTEFNRALVETRLGMPVEDALEGISARMVSEDFAWIVMAIRIHREVGGNLAEILTTVAATIRERERLRRQVRGLSAEGRLSAWILGALPPIFATYLILVRPTYIKPLFTDPLGVTLLGVMIVLMITGIFWLRRVVKVEV